LAVGHGVNARYDAAVITWMGSCMCCTLAIIYFYGLSGPETLDLPQGNHFEPGVAAFRTALIATLASSWAVWFGAKRKSGLAMAALRTGLATQVSLTLYGIAGCGGALRGNWHWVRAGWRVFDDLIFLRLFLRSTMFSDLFSKVLRQTRLQQASCCT
jgi:hypothetical protein